MNKFKEGVWSKEHTLSQNISRVNFKELQQIIKMGLVQGNLIPAFAGAWLAGNDKSFLLIINTSNFINAIWIYFNYGWRMCVK